MYVEFDFEAESICHTESVFWAIFDRSFFSVRDCCISIFTAYQVCPFSWAYQGFTRHAHRFLFMTGKPIPWVIVLLPVNSLSWKTVFLWPSMLNFSWVLVLALLEKIPGLGQIKLHLNTLCLDRLSRQSRLALFLAPFYKMNSVFFSFFLFFFLGILPSSFWRVELMPFRRQHLCVFWLSEAWKVGTLWILLV